MLWKGLPETNQNSSENRLFTPPKKAGSSSSPIHFQTALAIKTAEWAIICLCHFGAFAKPLSQVVEKRFIQGGPEKPIIYGVMGPLQVG